jgi:hypothetical protein
MPSIAEPPAAGKPRKGRKYTPPPRSVCWIIQPHERLDGYGCAQLTVGSVSGHYLIRQIPCDFGESAWEVEKLTDGLATEESYAVHLAGAESSCTCRGCSFHGHCKHLDGLVKLDQLGLLPRLLGRVKDVTCPQCGDRSPDGYGGPCPGCVAANDHFAAIDQMNEMLAGGIDPWQIGGEA